MNALWNLAKKVFREWREDDANRLAAALSFYAAISIAPLLVLALTIMGFVYGRQSAQQQILGQIQNIMGQQSASVLTTILNNANQPHVASFAGVLGIIVLLWGASNVFAQLQDAMNVVWDVELNENTGFWMVAKKRVLSFVMIVAIGFLLVVSMILSAALTFFNSHLDGLLPGTNWLWQASDQVVSFIIITFLFALIYKVLPDAKIAWRDVWWGAGVTALLFTFGKYLLGIYLGVQSVGSAYGAAGSLVVFLIWVYFSAQIFFLGAEFTQVYSRRLGHGLEPAENARYVEPTPQAN